MKYSKAIKKNKYSLLLLLILCIGLALTGCEKKEKNDSLEEIKNSESTTDAPATIVLSRGMAKNELFRIENLSCYVPEYMVYLTNIQKEYEKTYGSEIWNEKSQTGTLGDDLKDIALARISRVKTMNLLAEEYGLKENDEVVGLATDLSAAYYSTLSQKEIEALGIDQATLTQMYIEYIIADSLYDKIIEDVNPEISDDEARAVVVEQICIYKGEKNDRGEFIPFDAAEQGQELEKIKEAASKLEGEEAESFESVAALYNQAEEMTTSFARGQVEPQVEAVAFSLAEDEVSDIIETSESYLILKCVSMGAQDRTEENKKKIIEKTRQDTFTNAYDDFTKNLTKKMNDKVWQDIELIMDDEVTTDNFFSLYEANEPETLLIDETSEQLEG